MDFSAAREVSMASALTTLQSPPFTDARLPRTDVNGRGNERRAVPVVGNMLRRAAQDLTSARVYAPEPRSGAWWDRTSSVEAPRVDQTQVRADLDYVDLKRNAMLTAIQELHDELEYALGLRGGTALSSWTEGRVAFPAATEGEQMGGVVDAEELNDLQTALKRAVDAYQSFAALVAPDSSLLTKA